MAKTQKQERVDAVMRSQSDVLEEYFAGIASGEYYDGSSWQLYLDLDDGSLMIHQEVSSQSWLQREDGSLVQLAEVSGYCDTPADERYTDGCDLCDYGYPEWLDMISERIAEAQGAGDAA
jgi:hypothetical protein